MKQNCMSLGNSSLLRMIYLHCLSTTLFLKVKNSKNIYMFWLTKVAIMKLNMKTIRRKIYNCN